VTPELLNVIDNAIKILGPALITGMVGYFSASVQFTTRLKELDKNNEFKAREHLYNFYKEQRISSGEGVKPTLNMLENILIATASDDLNQTLRSRLQAILSQRYVVLDTVKQGMKYWNLTDSEPYIQLLAADKDAGRIDYMNEKITTDQIESLIRFYTFADLCTDKIMNESMNRMFRKYFTE
jgi:hypothetical protein